ncbi:pyrimidine-nucleoside phosphorylase [Pelosinus propionicus]|uniref:Pyrimidine-nucleoside phosphorylase n=1 Tax=Pelosinus propionicus DSM 13327 TaxID=1123291 RepID=A0A1I4KQY8_9FIRM|nr:pyrimidine-nucleoside phosphorylase [Pelosinus propionicus]SFL81016.1 pyrimidine-nucleoside phosphorylase [Pelosinus propionicus DSM 13327]
MRVLDVITKKRDGLVLTDLEIKYLIHAYTNNEIPDYQMAAWLMAIFFKGMTMEETASLTMAMAMSGTMIDLSAVSGIKVDKHSTGGVADTTTLVLAPLVAAAGVPVAKMSGRGLGFTGGTIDKLDAIAGFKSALKPDEFIHNLQNHNVAIIGQSADIAPADGKIYALRDVTATIESIPLIASSIMSKKIAAGADKILLDVKVGNGAFMKSMKDAVRLAETMVHIGQLVGRETRAVLSSMEEPLGQAIGNSLEVEEAIAILDGRGEQALRHVCLFLGAQMLNMAGIESDVKIGYETLNGLIKNKAALHKFKEFVIAQGGDADVICNPKALPQAKIETKVICSEEGYIQKIDAAKLGYCAMRLGAGREYKGQEIDLSAGILLGKRIGDRIEKGQIICTIYANNEAKIKEVHSLLLDAIKINNKPVPKTNLILGVVDHDGFKTI